ncbi:MAG: hypothetical protein H0U27_07510 [Nitrosopumilus sp.]|nr:hypothetical protein [Nitrosopumilus sp.]
MNNAEPTRVARQQAIQELTGKIENLVNDLQKQTKKDIAELELKIKTTKNQPQATKGLAENLKDLSNVFITGANLFNSVLGQIVNQPTAKIGKFETNFDQAASQLKKLRQDLDEMRKKLDAVKMNSSEYKVLMQDLDDLNTALHKGKALLIENIKDNTATPENNVKADNLIKDLNSLIKQANCSSIKTVGDTNKDKIQVCTQNKLNVIKAKTKIQICTQLTLKSTKADLMACRAAVN